MVGQHFLEEFPHSALYTDRPGQPSQSTKLLPDARSTNQKWSILLLKSRESCRCMPRKAAPYGLCTSIDLSLARFASSRPGSALLQASWILMQHLVSRLRRTCGIARLEAGGGSVHSNYKCIDHSPLLVMLLD